jgi:hypothetical protein
MQFKLKEWSGRWDSNPRLDLGKVPYYPYTTAAQNLRDFNMPANQEQVPRGKFRKNFPNFLFRPCPGTRPIKIIRKFI